MPPAPSDVKEAACTLRAIHAACTSPRHLPDIHVLRLVALQLKGELPGTLKSKDRKRLAAAGLIPAYCTALLRAFPEPGDADRLQTALELLLKGLPPKCVKPALDLWDTEAAARVLRDPCGAMQALKATLDEAEALATALHGGPLPLTTRVVQHALWLLRAAKRDGHTMLPLADVVARVTARTREATAAVVAALRVGVARGDLAAAGSHGLVEPEVCRDEAFVAATVNERVAARPALDVVPPAAGVNGETLAQDQVAAVATLLSSGLSILTGGPGTGKTTVIRALVAALGIERCMLTAPTGRAARNVSGATIHSASGGMLARRPIQETSKADVPSELALLVVDEASMLTTELMIAVLGLAPPGCLMVLVGDEDQLPPVGAGNVLKDLLACGAVPTARLTYNHRSATHVQRLAHDILCGRVPDLGADELVPAAGPDAAVRAVVGVCAADPGAQVLTPHNAQRAILSRALQSLKKPVPVRCTCPLTWGLDREEGVLTTDATGASTLVFGTKTLDLPVDGALAITAPRCPVMVGDAVMVLKNQNKKRLPQGRVSACNGDVGTLVQLVPTVQVDFGGGATAEFKGVDGWLTLAYAATVHKFQGSECDAVVLPLAPHSMWDRHLLYTAVTRARTSVTFVGTPADVRHIVGRVRPERHSALRALLDQQ